MGEKTYRGQKVTGGRKTYRRNLQGVKRHTGLETYMRNIQEWRDIQGGETDRSTLTYRRDGEDLQSGEETYRGSETYIKRNLQGVEKLTGGRD